MAPRRRTKQHKKLKSYEVERILDVKHDDMYLVKWKGYKRPTWEPLDHLDNCSELLQEFEFERLRQFRVNMERSSDGYLLDQPAVPSPFPCAYSSYVTPKSTIKSYQLITSDMAYDDHNSSDTFMRL
jgi:hypothetical protein